MKHYCINCGQVAAEQHHVVPLAIGGNDIDSNKVWLCSECHTMVHGTNKEQRGTHWKELQRAGIERAKAEGKFQGKKRKWIDYPVFVEDCKRWRAGECTATEVFKKHKISSQTFYRRVKEWGL